MKGKWMFGMGAVVLLLGLTPGTGKAAKGFYVSTGIGAALPTMSGDLVDEGDPGTGVAFEFYNLGYAFTKNFSVGTYWDFVDGGISSDFGDNAVWSEMGFGLNARYWFDQDKQFVPYIELGVAPNVFLILSDDLLIASNNYGAAIKLAVGGNYYFGASQQWFVAPEVSFNYVQFSGEADVEFEDIDGDFVTDLDTNASYVMVLVKVGYHWKLK